MKIPKQMLQVELAPAKSEEGARIADLKWYTGATVMRMGWEGRYMLAFSMKPEHVRMGRLESGKAPLLNSHSDWSLSDVIGVIESADLKGNARVRFSNRAEVTPIWQDVQDRIIRNASMGARIFKMKDITEKDAEGNEKTKSYLAVDWEPLEVSLVPMGADPDAGLKLSEKTEFTEAEIVSASEEGAMSARMEEAAMPEKKGTDAGGTTRTEDVTQMAQTIIEDRSKAEIQAAVIAETARIMYIREIVTKLNLPIAFGDQHIKAMTSVDKFNALALAKQVEEAERFVNTRTGGRVTFVNDEVDKRRLAMETAVFGLMSPKNRCTDPQNPFTGLSIKQVAAESVRQERNLGRHPDDATVAKLAMQTTADFASVLENVARKQLLAMYQLANPTYRLWTKPSTTPDFKSMTRTRLGEAPTFLKVPEGGQITIGAMTDQKETYTLATYGRGVSFTRQMLINDDLGAFNDLIGAFGMQAARLENKTVYTILNVGLLAAGNMADGTPLFAAGHSNVGTGVLGNTAYDAAFGIVGVQKGIDGVSILNLTPRFVIVPKALESTARASVLVTGPNLAATSQNWFAGRLEPVADAELDGTSTTGWYLACDPLLAPGIEYAHLAGAEGPQFIRKDNEQGILGIQFYAYLDFAAKAVDWRPLYRSTGA